MKKYILLFFLIASFNSFSQSKSFETLEEKFKGARNVTSFNVGSFVLKTALWLAGENDLRNDISEIKNLRFINIPQESFKAQNLRISGFKKFLTKDNFEEMIYSRDGRDHITVYMQDNGHKSNLYLVLIENEHEVTAIEIKGKLDPKKLIERNSKEKFSSI